MADLAHHPLHVEAVGQARDRDVGPPERVRGCPRERREPLLSSYLARQDRRLANDLGDALPADAAAAYVPDDVVLWSGRLARTSKPVEVFDESFGQVRTHL